MRQFIPAILLCLLLLPISQAPAAPDRVFITTVQPARGQRVRGAILADVNGDGKRDLLIATQNYFKNYDRRLRVHLRRDAVVCFGSEPASEVVFDPGDVAFAAADVAGGAGEEMIVLPLGRVLEELAGLTGRGDLEEVYDRIFSSFCIGK